MANERTKQPNAGRKGTGRAPEPLPMSDSGPRLLSFLPLEVLNHRFDALLWSVMFALAAKDVAVLRMVRYEAILGLASSRQGEPNWAATAERLEREQIAIESPSPQRFDLVLTKGNYPDEHLRVIFELRAQRGIGKRCKGPWPKCPPPDIVGRVLNADEVPTIAAGAIGPALQELVVQMEAVPPPPYIEPVEGDPDAPYHARDKHARAMLDAQMRHAVVEQREEVRLRRLADRQMTPFVRDLDYAIEGRGFDSDAMARQRRRRTQG